jgi:tetratricopeptide (TPR) repeat protein
MRLTDGVDEPRHQRAAELLVLGHCARGRFSQAIHLAEQQLQRAESIADVRARATAHASLGAALLLAAKAPSAVAHYERALADANAVEDVVVQIHVLSDLAGCFFEMRRYADCARLLAEARAKADTIGYRRHLAFNLSNEAQLRVAVGDDHATSCAAAAVRRSLEMGDLMAAANALHTWVAARPATAADPDLWRRLRAVDIDLGRTSVAAEDTADLAVASARRANTAEALTWAAEARTMGEESEQPYVVRRATFARIIADARSSRPADSVARNRLLAELAALTQHEDVSDVEQAEIGIERWRLTHTSADHEAAATRLRKAYAAEPSAQVRQWFNTIGEQPPTPPPALPPPVGIGRHQTTRADLMDAFDRLEEASAHARFE